MTCLEFKELLSLYVLGSLDDSERAACEAHLRFAHHEGCLEALAEQTEAVAALASELPPVMPGSHVWRNIEQQIGGVSVLSVPRGRASAVVPWVLFAAAAAAALFFWWGRHHVETELAELRDGQNVLRSRIETSAKSLAAVAREKAECLERLEAMDQEPDLRDRAMALLELPGTQLFPIDPTVKNTPYLANAILHTGVRRAFIVATGLKPTPGKGYEAWVIRGDTKHKAGMIKVDADGRGVLEINYGELLPPGETPKALAVTVEPEWGSEQPTSDPILAGWPKGG